MSSWPQVDLQIPKVEPFTWDFKEGVMIKGVVANMGPKSVLLTFFIQHRASAIEASRSQRNRGSNFFKKLLLRRVCAKSGPRFVANRGLLPTNFSP